MKPAAWKNQFAKKRKPYIKAHAFVRLLLVCKPPRTTFYEDKSKYNAGKNPTQLVSVQIISYVFDLAAI